METPYTASNCDTLEIRPFDEKASDRRTTRNDDLSNSIHYNKLPEGNVYKLFANVKCAIGGRTNTTAAVCLYTNTR